MFVLTFACSTPLTAATADAHCKWTHPGATNCGSRWVNCVKFPNHCNINHFRRHP